MFQQKVNIVAMLMTTMMMPNALKPGGGCEINPQGCKSGKML
jgi:hypothetical protein